MQFSMRTSPSEVAHALLLESNGNLSAALQFVRSVYVALGGSAGLASPPRSAHLRAAGAAPSARPPGLPPPPTPPPPALGLYNANVRDHPWLAEFVPLPHQRLAFSSPLLPHEDGGGGGGNCWDLLPDEMVLRVFSFVREHERTLLALAAVDHRFRRIVHTPHLWPHLSLRLDRFLLASQWLEARPHLHRPTTLTLNFKESSATTAAVVARDDDPWAQDPTTHATGVRRFFGMAQFDRVVQLELISCDLSRLPFDWLGRRFGPRLTHLTLKDCSHLYMGLDLLLGCSSLVSLHLEALPSLTNTMLVDLWRKCSSATAAATAPTSPAATAAAVATVPVGSAADLPPSHSFLASLEHLTLINLIRITDSGIHELLMRSPKLEHVHLERCHGITDRTLVTLGQVHACTPLFAHHTSTLPPPPVIVSPISNNSNSSISTSSTASTLPPSSGRGFGVPLRSFYIDGCRVSDVGLETLLYKCPQLRELVLVNQDTVTDLTIAAAGALCSELRSVTLVNCHLLTNAGASALADGTARKSLRHLTVSRCPDITPALISRFNAAKCTVTITSGEPDTTTE